MPDGAFEADDDWELNSAKDDAPEELRRIFESARAGADAAIERGLAAGGLEAPSVVTSRRGVHPSRCAG